MARVEAEEAKAWAQTWKAACRRYHDAAQKSVCVYCGQEGPKGLDWIAAHILTCEKRPEKKLGEVIRAMGEEYDAAEAEVTRLAALHEGAERHIGDLLTVQAQLVEAHEKLLADYERAEERTSGALTQNERLGDANEILVKACERITDPIFLLTQAEMWEIAQAALAAAKESQK